MTDNDLRIMRKAISALRDRNHEMTVVLDTNAALLDRCVELLDALDDLRIDAAVRCDMCRSWLDKQRLTLVDQA